MCAGRTGKQAERHLLVVPDRRECDILVSSSGWIAHDGKLEHKEADDRRDDNGMFAESFPGEPRPKDEGVLVRQPRAALRRMLEPEYAALERMHIFEPGRGRKVDEGARILVRLDANEGKQPKIAVTAKPGEQFRHVNAGMRLVNCLKSIATFCPRTWRSAQSAAMR
jgi:hypothetical protein